jgi:hypothetical protein
MINYDYKYARDRIENKKRTESRTSAALGAAIFIMYLVVSTMSYNDCLQGVC